MWHVKVRLPNTDHPSLAGRYQTQHEAVREADTLQRVYARSAYGRIFSVEHHPEEPVAILGHNPVGRVSPLNW